jgi:hypothetical protein
MCIHYALEWRVTANGKIISKETDPDLVLATGAFWVRFLRLRVDNEIYDKTLKNKASSQADCNITVSVNDRAEDDLIKCYSDHSCRGQR